MAFRRNTEHRNLPSSANLTEFAVGGFDYALKYKTNSYDQHPFSEEVNVNIERYNHKDQIEVLFPENKFEEISDTVKRQLEADEV